MQFHDACVYTTQKTDMTMLHW